MDAITNVGKTVVHAVKSVVHWLGLGPVSGGTVFYDANNNSVLDVGEANTLSAADGTFNLSTPVGGTGVLVGIGGIDTSTGLPNTLVLTVPGDATKISPLTTLVQNVLQEYPAMTEAQANTLVDQALGISTTIDLQNEHLLAGPWTVTPCWPRRSPPK